MASGVVWQSGSCSSCRFANISIPSLSEGKRVPSFSPTENSFLVLLSDQDKAIVGETAEPLNRYLLPCATGLGDLNSQDTAGEAWVARILGCEVCCSKKCQVALTKQHEMGVFDVSVDQHESRLQVFF